MFQAQERESDKADYEMKKLAYEKAVTQYKTVEAKKKKIDDAAKAMEDFYGKLTAAMERQQADIEKMKAANITGDKLTKQENKIKEG